jgi:hypothetical protein
MSRGSPLRISWNVSGWVEDVLRCITLHRSAADASLSREGRDEAEMEEMERGVKRR